MLRKIEKVLKTLFLIILVSIISFVCYLNYNRYNAPMKSSSIQKVSEILVFESIKSHHPRYKINWEPLKNQIEEILAGEESKYGIVIKDIETQTSLEINSDKQLHPASVYKVPLALIVLKDVENKKISLDDKLLITSSEKVYSFDPLSKIEGNYEKTIREILYYLIHYSDNTAMTTLEHRLGGVKDLQARMESELGIKGFTRLPGVTNAQITAEVFEGLYSQKYLSKELNDYLISLLKDIISNQNDRIPAGVPDGTEVAHKIGTLNSTYHDAGIVYGEKRDYVIVVLNDDINPATGRDKIRRISEATYNHLNK